jgi:CIC family chloride channel protein
MSIPPPPLNDNAPSLGGRLRRAWLNLRYRHDVAATWIEARLRYLRRLVREEELFLLAVALLLGAAVGSTVAWLRQIISALHHLLFGFSIERQWMQVAAEAPWRLALVPVIGGLLLGIGGWLYKRVSKNAEIVDAIEANALQGGRMSLKGSLVIMAKTVGSIGCGASVGIEAAITQFGAGLFSWAGQQLQLARHLLRIMVACGAAAAIGAAFNAPLAGIFYALELVLGSYSITALAPVSIAAISGTLVSQSIFGNAAVFYLQEHVHIDPGEYLLFALLGVGAAVIGVLAMRTATLIDGGFRRAKVPDWLRPAIGGAVLGLVALQFPYILGSGHGGIEAVLHHDLPLVLLITLMITKAFASAVSIGSGFTGGLFSASLFLGSLYGAAAGILIGMAAPALGGHGVIYTLVGMGTVAASIVGAPITMILLVFETTQEYGITIGVAVGVVVASVVTRRWFGFSFATWRFHLRGLDLRGAHDIGRLYELRVREILDRDILKVPPDLEVETIASLFLFNRKPLAFVVDETDGFLGVVEANEVSAAVLEGAAGRRARDLLKPQPFTVRPTDRLSTVLELFDRTDFEAIAVVTAGEVPNLVGCVHEADVHRRYFAESERMRREEVGYRD